MSMFSIDEVWPNFKLTPAEQALVHEQTETIRQYLFNVEDAAKDCDGKAIQEHWHMIENSVQYLNNVFNAKMHVAVHQTQSED